MEELNSIEKYRKQQKQEKLKRRTIFVLIIVTLILIVFSVDAAFKRMSDESKLPTYDEAELSKGFPITMPTSATYRLKLMGDDISLVTDTGLYVYDNRGDRILSLSHAYKSPVSESNDTRTLIYDANGTGFMCATRKSVAYTNTLTTPIVLGQISDNGKVCIVTDSDRYASVLYIYDKSGKEKYSVSMTEKIIACDFLPDSSGIVVSTVSANNGQVYSNLTCYKFKNTDKEEWTVKLDGTVIMNINAYSEDNVTAVGDNAVYTVKRGKLENTYGYSNALCGYGASDKLTAVLLDDSENRQKRMLIVGENGKLLGDTALNNEIISVCVSGNDVYAFDTKSVFEYNSDGKQIKSKSLGAEYDYFTMNSKNFYLLSDTIIDKLDIGDLKRDDGKTEEESIPQNNESVVDDTEN